MSPEPNELEESVEWLLELSSSLSAAVVLVEDVFSCITLLWTEGKEIKNMCRNYFLCETEFLDLN